MKKVLFFILFLAPLPSKLQAQSAAEIKSFLLEQKSIAEGVKVDWNAETRLLQIGRHLISISENTHLQIDRNDAGRFVVEFLLQKGTAVTDTDDPAFRRAYWTIPLQTRRDCKQFIALLEKL
jgi:hypothetical protein